MTVLPKWADMRAKFAPPGALLDADGLPTFPGPRVAATGAFSNTTPSALRGNGFSGLWKVTTAGGTIWTPTVCGLIGPLIAGIVPGGDPLFPLTITINAGAADSGPTANQYWWYLSQRSDNLRYVLANGTLSAAGQPQYFTMAHPDTTHSGTVVINTQSAQIAALFPGSFGVAPTDATSLATLFAQCALYVSRVSDSAYAWAKFVAS